MMHWPPPGGHPRPKAPQGSGPKFPLHASVHASPASAEEAMNETAQPNTQAMNVFMMRSVLPPLRGWRVHLRDTSDRGASRSFFRERAIGNDARRGAIPAPKATKSAS